MPRFLLALRSLGVALAWTLLSSLLGLLHLLLVVASAKLLTDSPPFHSHILLDGVLLFFSTALVSALTVDYFFSPEINYPKPVAGLLFWLYPAIIIGVSIWLFALCFGKTTADVHIQTLQNGTYALLIMALIYSTVVKSLEFIQR